MPPLPIPNPELVVLVLAVLVLGIITLAADSVIASSFATYGTFLTVGYIISRGIAKLGKVYEQR